MMNTILLLTRRNIRVYLRDRTSVFFSFLSVLIIIGLYVLFLGDMTAGNVQSEMGGMADPDDVRWLVDAWIMSGVLVINAMTVTLGALGVLVDDESKKRLGSFLVAPVRRRSIVQGYLIASMTVGVLLGMLTLAISQVYILANGGGLLPLVSLLEVIGLQILCVFSFSSIMFFLVSFVHTPNAFGTLSTLVGTLVGFLAGVYIPIGAMPPAVQSVMKVNPLTHAAALMRQIFMEQPLERVFSGAPDAAREGVESVFGVQILIDGTAVPASLMLLIVAGAGGLFLVLSMIRMRYRKLG